MRVNFIKTIFTVLAISLFAGISFSQTVYPGSLDGRVYVMLKEHVAEIPSEGAIVNMDDAYFVKGMQEEFGITSVKKTMHWSKGESMRKIMLIEFTEIDKVDLLIKKIYMNDKVRFAERAPRFELFYDVNDADYLASANNRWHLDKIEADSAWGYAQGNDEIIVAVIDNGMDINHPDLVDQYVASVDLADNDGDPTPPSTDLQWSHGTHTSGLVSATTNNGIGVASIGYDLSLMAVGVGQDSDGALIAGFEGITWAADTGAHVLNMSWGGTDGSQTSIMQQVVDHAYNQGCVLIAAAGNSGVDEMTYPAALNNVIAVGGTNGDDELNHMSILGLTLGGSNFGSWVDLCAPGFNMTDNSGSQTIYSCSYDDSYTSMSGTSMASPIVAGLAGLILAINPELPNNAVETILKNTCDDISGVQPDAERAAGVGSGRINARAAAEAASQTIGQVLASFSANTTSLYLGGSVDFTDESIGTGIVSYTWDITPATGVSFINGTDANTQNPTVQFDEAGTYSVTLTVNDGTDDFVAERVDYITVIEVDPNSAWIEQASGFEAASRGLYHISVVDMNTVWGSAVDGTNGEMVLEFSRTTDGGDTWTPGTITGVPSSYQLSSICGVSGDIAYASFFNNSPSGGDYGGIYKTEDGGATWNHQSTALFNTSSSFPNVVYMWDENNGWCMGDPADDYMEMYTTTDGGANWERVAQSGVPAHLSGEYGYVGMYDVYGSTIWFGTNKGRIFKSTDAGATWTVKQTALTDVQGVSFSDENKGIAWQAEYNQTTGEITSFTLLATSDGGDTWNTVSPSGPLYKGDIEAVPGSPGFMISVGSDGGGQSGTVGSSYSLDNGWSWTAIDEGVQYLSAAFMDSHTGWAGGFNQSAGIGGAYKWADNVVSNEGVVVEESSHVVYPNPSFGIVNLEYSNIDNQDVLINVYDVTGKLIKSVSEYNVSGNLHKTISIENAKKGIYLIKTTIGEQVITDRVLVQ